ncbi:hypothetical protein FB451DRAFT_1453115 [Mycena latifolia]|nr:hypothetical protein FB451DRAFT_1453115 [Mycena latifolia]
MLTRLIKKVLGSKYWRDWRRQGCVVAESMSPGGISSGSGNFVRISTSHGDLICDIAKLKELIKQHLWVIQISQHIIKYWHRLLGKNIPKQEHGNIFLMQSRISRRWSSLPYKTILIELFGDFEDLEDALKMEQQAMDQLLEGDEKVKWLLNIGVLFFCRYRKLSYEYLYHQKLEVPRATGIKGLFTGSSNFLFVRCLVTIQYLPLDMMSLKYSWGTDMRVPSRGSPTFVCPLFGNYPEMRIIRRNGLLLINKYYSSSILHLILCLSNISGAQIWRVPSWGSPTFVCPLFVNHPRNEAHPVEWATFDRQLLFFQNLTLDMLSLKYFWGTDVEGPIKGLSDFCLSAVWQPSRNEVHTARWADLWISRTIRRLSNIFWATGTEGPIAELSDICLVKKMELKKLDSLAHRCGLQLLEFHQEDTDTTEREEVKVAWCLGPMDCKKVMCSTNWVRAVALTHRDLVKGGVIFFR